MVIMGIRNMRPYKYLPMQLPFCVFEVRGDSQRQRRKDRASVGLLRLNRRVANVRRGHLSAFQAPPRTLDLLRTSSNSSLFCPRHVLGSRELANWSLGNVSERRSRPAKTCGINDSTNHVKTHPPRLPPPPKGSPQTSQRTQSALFLPLNLVSGIS